ncbi:MAG: hypothetical protein WC663_02295 [Patescibacteria group bacterium]|jgi:hypothetical protein
MAKLIVTRKVEPASGKEKVNVCLKGKHHIEVFGDTLLEALGRFVYENNQLLNIELDISQDVLPRITISLK